MQGLGNKLLIFSLGILLGIIVGGGVVWFIFGSSGKNIYIFNNSDKKDLTSQEPSSNSGSLKKGNRKAVEGDFQEAVNKSEATEKNAVSELTDSEKMAEFSTDGSATIDSTNMSFNQNTSDQEEIILKTDELLESRQVAVVELNINSDVPGKKDSLIQNLSGIKDSKPSVSYTLEYWKSPINYRGYKTSKNKIVLFGMPQADKPKLYRFGEELYLKNNDKSYKIKRTAEFTSYELVTDSGILSKLN